LNRGQYAYATRIIPISAAAEAPCASSAPPRIVREHKFAGENGPRDERRLDDFPLKAQVVELFDELDGMGDGVIDVLTVKHGLPFNMHVNLSPGAR
jgi:hypothetical protein